MFSFDDGSLHPDIQVVTWGVDEGQHIVITDHKRAQAVYRKITQNIESHETVDDLDAYMTREDLMLDALALFDPSVSDEIKETYEMHRCCLINGGAASRTHSGNPTAHTPESQEGNERKDNDCIW